MAILKLIDNILTYVISYDFKLSLSGDQKKELLNQLPNSPSSDRNKDPIFRALIALLPESGIVLEIGSNTGQHCQYFGQQIHSSNLKDTIHCKWQPTDYKDDYFKVIQRRMDLCDVDISSFALKPKVLDLLNPQWEKGFMDMDIAMVYISNVIHISAWQCSVGLFRGSGTVLKKGHKLVIYGPQIINDGQHEVKNESNLRFSKSLKSRNAEWGVRNMDDVVKLAKQYGLEKETKIDMPANNYIIVFVKQ